MSPTASTRPAVFGPEPWEEVAGRTWSHWDLWYALVAVLDHGGSLDQLEEHLVQELRQHPDGRSGAESKLSHLDDLRRRLADAELVPSDLATPETAEDRKLVAKAHEKLADRFIEGRALTQAMIDTPRARLVRRARTGSWQLFPVGPAMYYKSFQRNVEVKEHISKNRSFGAVERVEERLRSLDKPSLTTAQRLALYRAVHTAGLELIERTDDSYGNVGDMREHVWHTYLKIDWNKAGLAPETYWADLSALVVFEDYGLGFKQETLPWAHLPAGQTEMVEQFLNDLERECRAAYLDYQADGALQQLAWLAVAGRLFSRYAHVAARLGTDHWMPIEAMATSALRSGHYGLAVDVFRAADRPGFHQRHLRERCHTLTGVSLGDQALTKPGLRALRGGKAT